VTNVAVVAVVTDGFCCSGRLLGTFGTVVTNVAVVAVVTGGSCCSGGSVGTFGTVVTDVAVVAVVTDGSCWSGEGGDGGKALYSPLADFLIWPASAMRLSVLRRWLLPICGNSSARALTERASGAYSSSTLRMSWRAVPSG